MRTKVAVFCSKQEAGKQHANDALPGHRGGLVWDQVRDIVAKCGLSEEAHKCLVALKSNPAARRRAKEILNNTNVVKQEDGLFLYRHDPNKQRDPGRLNKILTRLARFNLKLSSHTNADHLQANLKGTGMKLKPNDITSITNTMVQLPVNAYAWVVEVITGTLVLVHELIKSGSDVKIAINWDGGWHHALRDAPYGNCHVNDVSLAALIMHHGLGGRILILDLDAHHGDGTEGTLYPYRQIAKVSIHGFTSFDHSELESKAVTPFFPGTGHVDDVGSDAGTYFNINLPLPLDTPSPLYEYAALKVIDEAVSAYQPVGIVMVHGGDSLIGDTTGQMCISQSTHMKCLRHVASKQLPVLVLGGGGYNEENVVRTWAAETCMLAGVEALPEEYSAQQAQHDALAEEHMRSMTMEQAVLVRQTVMTRLRKVMEHLNTARHIVMEDNTSTGAQEEVEGEGQESGQGNGAHASKKRKQV